MFRVCLERDRICIGSPLKSSLCVPLTVTGSFGGFSSHLSNTASKKIKILNIIYGCSNLTFGDGADDFVGFLSFSAQMPRDGRKEPTKSSALSPKVKSRSKILIKTLNRQHWTFVIKNFVASRAACENFLNLVNSFHNFLLPRKPCGQATQQHCLCNWLANFWYIRAIIRFGWNFVKIGNLSATSGESGSMIPYCRRTRTFSPFHAHAFIWTKPWQVKSMQK